MRTSTLVSLAVAALLAAGCAFQEPYRVRTVRPPAPVPQAVSDLFAVDQEAPPELSMVTASRADGVAVVVAQRAADGVTLERVLDAVEAHFPDLAVARLDIEAAEAKILASLGAFDTALAIGSKNKVLGYYQNRTLDVVVEQPLADGGITVEGGYRYGLGDFGSYDGDIETNAGGEVFLGVTVPVLRGSAIDARRAELLQARIARDAADPALHAVRIGLAQKASALYWKCVAARRKIRVARDLLELARTRQGSLEQSVAAGQEPPITLVDNERLVTDREALVVAATRDFERTAIALSIYFRDAQGRPVRVEPDDLPEFPEIPEIPRDSLDDHVRLGLEQRPEPRLVEFRRAATDVELAQRENDLLPRFDVTGFGSQDLGGSTAPGGVDDPLEFGIGVKFETPFARRKAKGRLAMTRTKLAQLGMKARLAADKVEGDVRDAASAYRRARERLALVQRAVTLAEVMEQAERSRLEQGESDLLRVNLREQSTAKARSDVISALADCLIAVSDYRAAMGLPAPPSRP